MRRRITSIWLLVLGVLGCCLLQYRLSVAEVRHFTEDFATTQYKDAANTTALWDTTQGEIKLPPLELTFAGRVSTSGVVPTVAVSGDYAYIVDEGLGHLLIVAISDPTAPAIVGSYDTQDVAYGVAVSGNRAYVGNAASGLRVIDISDPANPVLLGSCSIHYAVGVAISGDYAYVAAADSGLQVIDVSDPTSPVSAGSYDTPGSAHDVVVVGGYAYVTDWDAGLQVISIGDPSNLTLAGSYDAPSGACGVAISGDYAYVTDWFFGLHVLDISDPTSPAPVGSYDTPGSPYGIAISGDNVYVADYEGGLQVLDISNPAAPVFKSGYDAQGPAHGVAISGGHAFVTSYSPSGLEIVRIAEPVLPPEPAGNSDTSGEMQTIVIDGDYAYVGASAIAGIGVFDISDPTSPTLAGSFAADLLRDFVVDGDYAYVANVTPEYQFQVVDISNPTNPTSIATLQLAGYSKYLAVQGHYAFVGCDYAVNGFKVVDISDPTNPVLVGDPPFAALPIACDGDYAYIGYTDFKTVDISDPTNPVLIATCATPSHDVSDIVIAGDYAYAADWSSGVQVIDISDPTSPVIAGSYDTSGEARHVEIAGDLAFVADGSGFMQLLDISDPTTPTLAASYTTGGISQQVAIAGDFMYTTTSTSGVHVAQVFQRAMKLDENIGQSLDVSPYVGDIMEARLTSSQSDIITWEMSADAGSNWQPVMPDGSWTLLAFRGDDFRWRSTHAPVNLGTNPTCSSLRFDFIYEFPVVDEVEDVANDQGRQVSVAWTRSGYDRAGSATPITEYAIYRQVDMNVAASRALLGCDDNARDPRCRADGDPLLESLPPGSWYFVRTVPALAEDNYATVVPTLVDSTKSEGIRYSTFVVLALTATPGVYFESPPDSGYSVDNLPPSSPEGFVVAYQSGGGNQLGWEPAPEEDFRYWRIYRSTTSDFTPSAGNLVETTAVEGWVDPVSEGWQYYYKISSVDFAGNESDPAAPTTVTGIDGGGVPATFALRQNVPNPFNPTTVIYYDVPESGGSVTLRIYDVAGRLVRTLVDGQQPAGERHVTWDGRDDHGSYVASGVYFYRMTAPGFEVTRKMTLLQ